MDGTNLESAISEISYFLYVSTKSVPADTLMLLETIQFVKTCSKLTINAQERHQHLRWSLFINKVATHGKMKVLVALATSFIMNLEQNQHIFLLWRCHWTDVCPLPSWHLLVQSQQWKHQNNVWNLFKFNSENFRWRQWLLSGVFTVDFEQLNAGWVGGTQTSEYLWKCIPNTLGEEASFGGQRSYV